MCGSPKLIVNSRGSFRNCYDFWRQFLPHKVPEYLNYAQFVKKMVLCKLLTISIFAHLYIRLYAGIPARLQSCFPALLPSFLPSSHPFCPPAPTACLLPSCLSSWCLPAWKAAEQNKSSKSVCLPVLLSFFLPVFLAVCFSVCLPFCALCLYLCMSMSVYVCLYICRDVNMFVFLSALLPAFLPSCALGIPPAWLPACLLVCLSVLSRVWIILEKVITIKNTNMLVCFGSGIDRKTQAGRQPWRQAGSQAGR